ncbi:MAG TPA: hypothetical protein PLI51_04180 [bacterium]|nr:hypothetical protein [bacterium]HPQ65907.1 hypothetical protein [bacterium]
MKTLPRPFSGTKLRPRAGERGRRWREAAAAATVLAAAAAAGDWSRLGGLLSTPALVAVAAAALAVTAGKRARLADDDDGIDPARGAAWRTVLEGFFLGSFTGAAFPVLVGFETGRLPGADGSRRDPAPTAGWALALGSWSAAAALISGSALPLLLLLPAAAGAGAALLRTGPAAGGARAFRTDRCAVSALEALLLSTAGAAAAAAWFRAGAAAPFPPVAAALTAGPLAAAAGTAVGGGPGVRILAAAVAALPLAGFAAAAGMGMSVLLVGFFPWAAGGILYLAGGYRRKRASGASGATAPKRRQPWA